MENINLLTYFGIGAIGMIIGLRIALIIMQASRPHSTYGIVQEAPVTTSNDEIFFNLIGFILLSMFTYWIVINYSHRKPLQKIKKERKQESLVQTPQTSVVKENRRVNRSPRTKSLQVSQYGIQMLSVSDRSEAEIWATALSQKHRVQIVREGNSYKVIVIGNFKNRIAALDYQKKARILRKGFIRLVSS